MKLKMAYLTWIPASWPDKTYSACREPLSYRIEWIGSEWRLLASRDGRLIKSAYAKTAGELQRLADDHVKEDLGL